MRLDLYISKVGIIKRRTRAKELATAGLIDINGHPVKASYEIKIGDIIRIGGKDTKTAEVLDIPGGNVKKEDRDQYFRLLK